MSAEAQATEAIPVHQMPLVRTELREVHRALTPDERVDKDHDMHRLKREILEEEESLKSYTKERKGAIAKLETERDALIEVGEKGRSEWVDVEIRLDVEAGRRIVVQKETGELLGDEPMQYADRQPNLFPATLEDGAPAVPVSRQVRAAFLSTLGGTPGGGAVLRLQDEGLLDPTDFEIESQRAQIDDDPDPGMFRDWIAEAESDLDEMEATLVQMLDDDGCSEADVIAIAINSRTAGAPDEADAGAIWDKLLELRDARAAIDFAHGELMKTRAETVEHDDRSEQLEPADRTVVITEESAKKIHQRTGELLAEFGPHSRALRTFPVNDRVARWGVDEYWTAHEAGLLDPSEDDLRRARAEAGFERMSADTEAALLNELDAVEQDLAAAIKTSAKARMAITRGTWPTKVAKVDDGIAAVRELRARLDVDLEAEASA